MPAYQELEALRPDLKPMFGRLRKMPLDVVASMRQRYPRCPSAYWTFLLERGAGALEQDGEAFWFFDGLASAERDIFKDREIYEYGASGDVMIFGSESAGISYGFDTGADWMLVEVDHYRIVTPLELTFEQFVVGLVLCYPQIATKVVGNDWFDRMERRYRLPAR